MTRGGTSVVPGRVYHAISRFVAKEWSIESSDERRVYLSRLRDALARTDWRCFAFALTSSHIHLGVVAASTPLRDWLRPMHTTFAQWINPRREPIGAVFVRGPDVIAYEAAGTAQLVS